MSGWAEHARSVIQRVSAELPAGIMLGDRVRAIDEAYPFGTRAHWPYKMWLKERRAYLTKYGWLPKGHRANTPLFPELTRDPVTGRPVIP